jgi:N-acetylneuraminic acid mutarotase
MKTIFPLLAIVICLVFISCQKETQPTTPPVTPPARVLSLLSFSPDSAQIGDTVFLRGRNFDTAVSRNTVLVNTTAASVISVTDSTMRIKVNAGSTTGKITLTSGGLTVVSTGDLRIYTVPWVRKADFPVFVGGPIIDINGLAWGFSSADKGYFIRSNQLWEYSPATDSWASKASLPSTKSHFLGLCFTIGNKAYVGLGGAGLAGPNFLSPEIWEYDMTANTWTRKADFPGPRRITCFSFAAGGFGYVGGGDTLSSNQNPTNDFWQYNPQTDTWARKADYPGVKRLGSLGFGIGNTGYVLEAGYGTIAAPFSGSATTQLLWSYDAATNSWQQKSTLNQSGITATVFVLNGKAYAALGRAGTMVNGQLVKDDFWEYDPQQNSWTKKPQVGGPLRYFPCSFAVGGKGYVGLGTGATVTDRYKDFWQYTP